jgi:hypothetical protein
VLEYWKNGFRENAVVFFIGSNLSGFEIKAINGILSLLKPTFQYSTIPLFRKLGENSDLINI